MEKTQKNSEQTEMSSTLEGISSRKTKAEEWTNDLEERMMEITAPEQHIEKRMKRNKDSLGEFWGNIKHISVPIIGLLPEGEREQGPEEIFEEITAENFLNMRKEIVNQTQEAQRPPQDKPKEERMRHIVIKLTKIKDENNIVKATK